MKEQQRFTRKEAIALSYDPEVSDAPKVIAKGKGKIAENILEQRKNMLFLYKKIQVCWSYLVN